MNDKDYQTWRTFNGGEILPDVTYIHLMSDKDYRMSQIEVKFQQM